MFTLCFTSTGFLLGSHAHYFGCFDQETNAGLLNFGDCDRQEMALLNQRFSVSQSCFLCINCTETIS